MAITSASPLSRSTADTARSIPSPVVDKRLLFVALGLLLVVLAAFLRFYRLHELPGGLYYDEAQNGVDVLGVLAGDRPVYFPANNGREPLFIYLQAVAVTLLGPTPFALRMTSAIVGTATVIAIFLVGRELHGWRVGYLAAFWLAISPWHLSLSRLGLRTVLLPLVALACVYFLAKAFRGGSALAAALAGLCLGLSLYTYGAARFFPLAILAVAMALWLGRRRAWPITLKHALKIVAIVAIVGILVASPLALYFLSHPEFLFGRSQQVFLGSDLDPRLLQGLRPYTLPENAAVTVGMFGFSGDELLRHNFSGQPVFDLPAFALFVAGIALSLRQGSRWIGLLYLPWLLLLLIPGAISIEAPHFLRTVGALPPAFLILGLAGDYLLRRASGHWRLVATALIFTLLLQGAIDSYAGYFRAFSSNPNRSSAFDSHVLAAAERTGALRAEGYVVWVAARQEHPDFRFLLPPEHQPTLITDSIAKAVAAAQERGSAASLVCYGCDAKGVEPIVLVFARTKADADLPRPANRPMAEGTLSLEAYQITFDGTLDDGNDAVRLESRLYWRPLDIVGTRYRATLLLVDPQRRIVGMGIDGLIGDYWPTTLWRTGERYATSSTIWLSRSSLASISDLRLEVELVEFATDTVTDRLDLGPVALGSAARSSRP